MMIATVRAAMIGLAGAAIAACTSSPRTLPDPDATRTTASVDIAAEAIERGRSLTSTACSGCHAPGAAGANPLADVGQQVKVGEALCIIEAMKIMNEIDSDVAGTVTKVLVDNGQAVEYGQPLFIIE